MKQKIKMAILKKLSISMTTKSWAIFANISPIGPWVSRINWCQGHWFCSTYMVVRLSNVSSIYCKKCIFSVFCSKVFHLIYFYCEKKHLCTKKFKMQGFPSWHKWKYHVFCFKYDSANGEKIIQFLSEPRSSQLK